MLVVTKNTKNYFKSYEIGKKKTENGKLGLTPHVDISAGGNLLTLP